MLRCIGNIYVVCFVNNIGLHRVFIMLFLRVFFCYLSIAMLSIAMLLLSGPKIWNAMPAYLIEIKELNNFKHKFKLLLHSKYK